MHFLGSWELQARTRFSCLSKAQSNQGPPFDCLASFPITSKEQCNLFSITSYFGAFEWLSIIWSLVIRLLLAFCFFKSFWENLFMIVSNLPKIPPQIFQLLLTSVFGTEILYIFLRVFASHQGSPPTICVAERKKKELLDDVVCPRAR